MQTLEWSIDNILDICVKALQHGNKFNSFETNNERFIEHASALTPLLSITEHVIKLLVILEERKKIKKDERKDDDNEPIIIDRSNPESSSDYILEWKAHKLNPAAQHVLLRLFAKAANKLSNVVLGIQNLTDKANTHLNNPNSQPQRMPKKQKMKPQKTKQKTNQKMTASRRS